MKKPAITKQLTINRILIAAIILLAGYSTFLTYEITANRAASESVDKSLVEMMFKMQTDKAADSQN